MTLNLNQMLSILYLVVLFVACCVMLIVLFNEIRRFRKYEGVRNEVLESNSK